MYTLGIDIGSTTSKCAVLKDGEELVATSLRVGGMGTEGPQEALDDLWADSGLRREEMAHTIVTGYGRKNYEGADGEVSELTCHAMGGRFVFPGLRTVIDIGRSGREDHLPDRGRPDGQLRDERQMRGRYGPLSGCDGVHPADGCERAGSLRRTEHAARVHLLDLHGVR